MNKKYKFYGYLIYLILKLISLTLKIKIINNYNVDGKKDNYIFAFWHNKLLGPSLAMKNFGKSAVLASPSKDGELISIPLEHFGFEVIRGSSDKNASASLRNLLKAVKKGYNIGTPVDGPKGPIYEVKPGLLYVAQKTQKYIVPTGTYYNKKWIFSKTWDKFELPKPFSKIIFIIGEPMAIGKNENIEDVSKILKEKINDLNLQAKNYF